MLQGEKELEVLVDIAMLSFRKRCCALASLLDLCTAIRHLSDGNIQQELYAKLTLVPMLGYGLWSLLELQPTERHPFHDEYADLDKFFVEWNYEDSQPQNAIVHISWHLFRSIFSTITTAATSGHSSIPLHSHTLPPVF